MFVTLRVVAAQIDWAPPHNAAPADCVLMRAQRAGEGPTGDGQVADKERLGRISDHGAFGLLFAIRMQGPVVTNKVIPGFPATREEEVGIECGANDLGLGILKVDAERLLLKAYLLILAASASHGPDIEESKSQSSLC